MVFVRENAIGSPTLAVKYGLKEYHSFDKLQAHLRRSDQCRAQLCTRATQTPIMPGIGSRDNAILKAQHDDLLPVQQAAGPRTLQKPPGEIDLHHVHLFEQLILLIMDSPVLVTGDLQHRMRTCIQTYDISWTQTQLTLRHVHQATSLLEEYDCCDTTGYCTISAGVSFGALGMGISH